MNQVITVDYDINEFSKIAELILDLAKQQGATQAELVISGSKGFSVSAHDGDVETVEYHQDRSIMIKVYFGKRSGSSSISDLRKEAIHAAVLAACHIAKFTDEDPASGLADRDDLAFGYQIVDPSYSWNITVSDAIKMAIECEKIALSQDKRITSAESVSVNTGVGFHLYANSQGFLGYVPESRHEISCILVAKDKGGMQRDYAYTTAIDPDLLKPVEAVALEAAKRTVNRLNPRKIKTGKIPVIYAAEEARGFFGHFAAAISGGNIYRHRSFLVDHLEKQIFPEFISIHENPTLEKAVGSEPFDSDGVATRHNQFVQNGILKQYALGCYSARKLGMKTTGNAGGMHNLIVEPGEKSFNDLLKTMGRGLLITELMGQGVNLLTGDYSRGVAGYWVEGGEIQYPVQEVTAASRLQDMYQGIVAVANDVDTRGNLRTGSVMIDEMMIAGE